jgi:pimeloyl-ACP methyl ester carboxylesterase
VVVGHDWGAAVAWWLGLRHPMRLAKLVILNGPHPIVMAREVRRNRRQLLKSAYMFFFQLPLLPEFMTRINNWRPTVASMRRSARPGTFSDEDFAEYRHAWSQPGAFTAMLNWYRALRRHPPSLGGQKRVTVPTLLIWGAQDAFLEQSMAQPSIELCDDGQLVMLEEATHWLHHEEPELINELVLSFLKDTGLPSRNLFHQHMP